MATLTTNKNFLSPTGFQFVIDRTKYPNLEYFCTSVTLPTVDLAEAPTPYRGANIAMTGDRMNFGDLVLQFNVTENMENYIETFQWMNDIVNKGEANKADATLVILSSHLNKTQEIKFSDCFPVSLDALEFNTQTADVEYLQASVTFKYTYYEII